MSIATQELRSIVGHGGNVRTPRGEKIGSIGQIYIDETTGEPSWVTVKTGFFGTKESFVPLRDAIAEGDDIVVDCDKDTVKDAPRIDADQDLTPQEEEVLYRHYGLGTGMSTDTATTGHDRSQETRHPHAGAESAGESMTVSEERLRVGKEQREAGRMRLRKFVVTENVTATVPVTHEEVRLEREPMSESDRGAGVSSPKIGEAEQEVILHEERPVVQKETVATERVRLTKEAVTHEETVSGEVRKERVEAETDKPEHGVGREDRPRR
jgi:uncharacterized protein (TIGR02271 family)